MGLCVARGRKSPRLSRLVTLASPRYTRANGYEYDSEVVYGDTDSVMIKFGEPDLAKVERVMGGKGVKCSSVQVPWVAARGQEAILGATRAPSSLSSLLAPVPALTSVSPLPPFPDNEAGGRGGRVCHGKV